MSVKFPREMTWVSSIQH